MIFKKGEYVLNYRNQVLKIINNTNGFLNLKFTKKDKTLGWDCCVSDNGVFGHAEYDIKEVLSFESNPELYL